MTSLKRSLKLLHLLVALSLLLAFAWPAAAAETVNNNVYGQEPPVIPGILNVTVKAAEAQLTLTFPKKDTMGNEPETFEIKLTPTLPGSKAKPVSATVKAGDASGANVTYTANNLEGNNLYKIAITGKKGAEIVSTGEAAGSPVYVEPKLTNVKATAGDASVTVSFDKLVTKAAADAPVTYQIHWWSEVDKKTKQPKYQKPITVKAADLNKTGKYSYTFKKLKNGTKYNFNVFAVTADKRIIGLQTLNATPKAPAKTKKKK